MSNNEALIAIETSSLSRVTGGGTTTIHGELNLPHRGGGNVQASFSSSDYEACLAAARRTANESYPDRRNPWEKFTGAVDLNAQRRANYERQGSDRCLAIARNSAPPGAN